VISDSGFKGIGSPSWVAPTQGEAVGFGQSFAVAHFALAFGGDFRKIRNCQVYEFSRLCPASKARLVRALSFLGLKSSMFCGSGMSR
jgi:hypothetical protein